MAVSPAIDLDIPFIVATSGQRLIAEADRHDVTTCISWICNRYLPTFAGWRHAHGEYIASKIDESTRTPRNSYDFCSPIHGKFLADAAKVDFHPRSKKV